MIVADLHAGLTVIGTRILSQLPGATIEAVSGNCVTIIVSFCGCVERMPSREFAASGESPRTAEQAYDIIIPASELQNLPDYTLYVRTLLNRQPLELDLVHSFPPFEKTGTESDPQTVIRTSLERYGRDRLQVEKSLAQFLRLAA